METEKSASETMPKDWKLSDLVPVLQALRGVRFGSVELVIQDGRLVQIERKEKIRTFRW
jgi:hypothetical protein